MDANARPYLEQSSDLNLFAEMFGFSAGEGPESGAPNPAAASPAIPVEQRRPFSLFPSLWSYVEQALGAVTEAMDRRGEKLDLRAFPEQERLEITPPPDLQRRYERYPRELRPPSGQRLVVSTEVAATRARKRVVITYSGQPSPFITNANT